MRTMFVTQDNSNRKRFQKPNILRKRTKVTPKPNAVLTQESPDASAQVSSLLAPEIKPTIEKATKVNHDQSSVKKPIQLMFSDIDGNEIFELTESDDTQNLLLGNSILINNNDESFTPATIDVESFLNNSVPLGSISLQEIQSDLRNNRVTEQWCLDFMNNQQEIIIEDVDGSQLGSLRVTTGPTVTSMPLSVDSTPQSTETSTNKPGQNISLEYLSTNAMKFKCDVPDCKKRFRSEKAFKKHKVVHENGPKVARQVTLECPVKKVSTNGVEDPCGVLCHSKEELVQHLNENHSPQDAMYICAECGRRFFWASGLRAHARAHCGRGGGGGGGGGAGGLQCAWAGCGRTFRQPCRLREHMRAHTGDKPYPCQYPNCSWSFRSASKLMRHTLRHTGERRHACVTCGRAFRRREHLRDHHKRHHCDKHACSLTGCEQSFTSLATLRVHMQVEHQQELEPTEGEADTEITLAAEQTAPATLLPLTEYYASEHPPLDTFMISLDSPSLNETMTKVAAIPRTEIEVGGSIPTAPPEIVVARVEGGQGEGSEGGKGEVCHAARTHCTWPLEPRTHTHTHTTEDRDEQWKFVDAEYVLEEDVQVELSEGSETNIYTIRSDLFLHGNVLNNEDSEQMPGSETGSQLVIPQSGESDLSLLDAHPTIDLMQEDIMYTDSAVDESPFRVFLLSEELS